MVWVCRRQHFGVGIGVGVVVGVVTRRRLDVFDISRESIEPASVFFFFILLALKESESGCVCVCVREREKERERMVASP